MKTFGAGCCVAAETVPVPVGEACAWCEEPVAAGDTGVVIPHEFAPEVKDQPWHHECFMRSIVGSVGHMMKGCSCYGGNLEDPPHLTKRQAAQMALDLWKGFRERERAAKLDRLRERVLKATDEACGDDRRNTADRHTGDSHSGAV